MPDSMGDTLRSGRVAAGLSVKDVAEFMTSRGYKAGANTIYSWENNNSQPTPDAFLTLCNLYKISDILATFGYNRRSHDLPPSQDEQSLLTDYRNLDDPGQAEVKRTITRETTRCKTAKEAEELRDYILKAARDGGTFEKVTDPNEVSFYRELQRKQKSGEIPRLKIPE